MPPSARSTGTREPTAEARAHAAQVSGAIVTGAGALAWWANGVWTAMSGVLVVLGLVVGVLGSALLSGWVARRERERAPHQPTVLPIGILLCGAALGVAALHALNGALDDAPGRVERGVIVSACRSNSNDKACKIRWNSGETEWAEVPVWSREGSKVERFVRPGALGFSWVESIVVH